MTFTYRRNLNLKLNSVISSCFVLNKIGYVVVVIADIVFIVVAVFVAVVVVVVIADIVFIVVAVFVAVVAVVVVIADIVFIVVAVVIFVVFIIVATVAAIVSLLLLLS